MQEESYRFSHSFLFEKRLRPINYFFTFSCRLREAEERIRKIKESKTVLPQTKARKAGGLVSGFLHRTCWNYFLLFIGLFISFFFLETANIKNKHKALPINRNLN